MLILDFASDSCNGNDNLIVVDLSNYSTVIQYETVLNSNIQYLKGVVRWYCSDVKPSNLTACFIMKCDAICYYYVHQNGRPWTAVYNNV